MAELSDADRLYESPSGTTPSPQPRSRRIDRRELRLLGGIIVALIGIALLITVQVVSLDSLSSEGWFLIAAAACIAVGLMLIALGMTGRASRLGEALFVATPGGLLAVVGFTAVHYLEPFQFSQVFELTWVCLAFLGLLWIVAGPIFMYRAKTRLWVGTVAPDANKSAPIRALESSRPRSDLATWFLVFATILGPVLAWSLIRFLGS